MLTWDSSGAGIGPAPYHQAAVADEPAVPDALVELWAKVLDELDARPAETGWDALLAQVVTADGSVLVVPIARAEGVPAAGVAVSLSVRPWEAAYYALPDPDDEEAFTAAHDRLEGGILDALKGAIADPRVKKRFAALKKRPGFAVFWVDAAETPARDRMEFLWGNKPPRRDFASARELFEHLFHKAELDPEWSLRLDGDRVTGVNWFGHEFDDRFVAVVEGTPGVAGLCSDLAEFVLTATRVTPAGVERLRRALPHARLTVVSDDEFDRGVDPWHDPDGP